MLQHWSGLSRQSKRLLILGSALLFLTGCAITATTLSMRGAARQEAGRNIERLGVAISEQTSRAVQTVDVVLHGLQSRFQLDGETTEQGLRRFFATRAMHEELALREEQLPQADGFVVVDADGQIINSSRIWPAPDVNIADRGFFRRLRDHDDQSLVVSGRMVARTDGRQTVYLARRIDDADGKFLGMIVGSLDLQYFENFYRAVGSGVTSVALMRSDGAVLTRFPAPSATHDVVPAGSPWYRWKHDGHAQVTTLPSTKGPVMLSSRAIADYPIVVDVGVTERQVFALWREQATMIAVGSICSILCVGLLLRALGVQFRRLERSEASLVSRNASLQQAHARLNAQAGALAENQRALAEKSMVLQTTLETMDQGLMTVDESGAITVYNRRLLEMLDLPEKLLAARPQFTAFVSHLRDAAEFEVPGYEMPGCVGKAVIPSAPHCYERRRPNGATIEIRSIPLGNGGMVRTFTDISARRQSEERVRYFAHHDGLTNLANRIVFQERLLAALAMAERTGRSIAVLCLDLDRFKQVNDTRGHAVGDKLLAEVSARLRLATRETDTVARMGGDEFAIIQPLLEQPESAESLAARLVELVAAPYDLDGTPAEIGVSIGIAVYPAHGKTTTELMSNADTALYRAKTDGRGMFRMFEGAMETQQRATFQLEQDLRHALAREELELLYQPIAASGSRRVLGYEALLRWNHANRGTISPADFIPIAELTGAVVPIGMWVLETACAEATTWPEDIRLSVNLSPAQFRQGDLARKVKEVLARCGLRPERLSLEVTEGMLLDGTKQVLRQMTELREAGVRFSLDDFGTAHAGLSYLRCFPFDAIKIDKSYVQDAVSQPEARALVEAILAMGSALHLTVIAEGVETEEQLRLLRKMQCQEVQGYLTGRPARASAIATRARAIPQLA